MRERRQWSERVAVVTGAGSGIGREIALGLLKRGAAVAGIGRRIGVLDALGEASPSGARFAPFPLDIRDEGEVAEGVRRIEEELGRPDVLVNNAGIATFAAIPALTTEVWDEMMAVNLRGPFLLTRALLPGMLKAGEGHILMNISVAGIKAFEGCGAYGASKAGLLGFTKVLREETRGKGVRVTALIPGAANTSIWGEKPPPVERLIPPRVVAEAALWALDSDPGAVPEEILLRPPGGDL